jgi:hypothetical protein
VALFYQGTKASDYQYFEKSIEMPEGLEYALNHGYLQILPMKSQQKTLEKRLKSTKPSEL